MSPDVLLRVTRRPEPRALRLHEDDPVAVALTPLADGETFDTGAGDGTSTASGTATGTAPMVARGDVPRGHKVALRPIAAGELVRKYGEVIGVAKVDIAAGTHVHTHNLGFHEAVAGTAKAARPRQWKNPPATFDGIVRADGRVGTRNYVAVLSTVNCSATIAKVIAAQAEGAPTVAERDDVDGVVAITHTSGCGLAGDGEGLGLLRRTLLGYARHPNVAAVLVLGLGCEVNEIGPLIGTAELGALPVRTMTVQEVGGTTATIRAGVTAVIDLVDSLPRISRTPVPASALTLALKCGGSDSYSGLTANPALGAAADLLISQGGAAVLGETPEIYGAHHLLAARATDPEVAESLLRRVDWWQDHVALDGASLDQNPSPGNRRGGITTIAEKSLGAVAKSGTSALTAVVGFAEPVPGPGLTFMDTPGYDPVSVTGMIAGGATVVCFTTGRGSVFGSRPAPCLKLATNSEMYARMADDMDLDCGRIAEGTAGVEEVGRQIFELVLRTASGRRTRSEELGFGQEEFVPWQRGVVL